MFNSAAPSLSDIAAVTGNNNGDGFNDGGWWVLIILFALFGWGRGYGGQDGSANGSNGSNGYVLATDFANIERKIDGVNNGLCDGFYAQNTNMLNGFSGIQNALCQGFAGVNTGMVQQGYETRLGMNNIQQQLADCCCTTQQSIQANTTQGVLNTNAIQQQISQCCCDNEKATMQASYQAQQNNCATLQAIDNLGDRIIDYMSNQETQRLRDENQTLRFTASQQAQNNYLINNLRPTPIPAYPSCNPWASYAPYGTCTCAATTAQTA